MARVSGALINNISGLQQLIEPLWRSHPFYPLVRPAVTIDGVHPHPDAVHQPAGRGSNAAKAKDSTHSAREHAVLSELIKLAKLEVFVL